MWDAALCGMLLSVAYCLGNPGKGANADPGLLPSLMSPGACGSSCHLQPNSAKPITELGQVACIFWMAAATQIWVAS